MRRVHLLLTALTSALILIIALVPSSAQAEARPSTLRVHPSRAGWCLSLKIPVGPSDSAPRIWQVWTEVCLPFHRAGLPSLDILTHGATYTHTYWDWPQQVNLYSYVGRTLASGRAVLTYDRIGNGASTRPLSTEVTMASDAHVLHQIVTAFKFLGSGHVNSIGHSYGSGVALQESVTYHDVDSLVLTGYLHRPSNPAVTAGNYPANLDPKFQDQGLDSGWLTSRPDVRGNSFHSATSDPEVVTFDEKQKDLVSLTGLLQFLAARGVPAGSNISRLTDVPVLVVTGQRDAIFCYQPVVFNCADEAVVQANEDPFYGKVTSRTIPGAGHDLTLHPSADASYRVINAWLQE